MGSSQTAVLRYFLAEGLSLLLLAAIPALVIALHLQMADLTVHTLVDTSWERFLVCFAGAVVMLAGVIALSIWYPAHRVMHIVPAEALHDE